MQDAIGIVVGIGGNELREFCGAGVTGAGTSLFRSPGGAMKHTGTTGISGRREAATGTGTAGARSTSHLPLPPLPLCLEFWASDRGLGAFVLP